MFTLPHHTETGFFLCSSIFLPVFIIIQEMGSLLFSKHHTVYPSANLSDFAASQHTCIDSSTGVGMGVGGWGGGFTPEVNKKQTIRMRGCDLWRRT